MANNTFNYVNRIGEIHRGIEIIEELGKDKVRAKCINCGHIDTYTKSVLVKDRALCKKCRNGIRTSKGRIRRNTVGKTYGNIEVLEEIGRGRVIGKCIICGNNYEFDKYAIMAKHIHSCGCGKRRKLEVGKTYNSLKVIAILDDYSVSAECTKCGKVNQYGSDLIQNGTIRQCMKCTLSL